jgi:hypothetical protein
MRKQLTVSIAGALAVVLLVAAPGASAATEFGSSCVGDAAAPDYTVIQLGDLAAPVPGVITKWKLSVVSEAPAQLPEQLKVLRATGTPNQFQVIGESAMSNVSPGANEFDTRISVQAGDRLGLFGGSEVGALYCRTEIPTDKFGAFKGNATTGSTVTSLGEEANAQVPVLAVIEPDADNDGYGDETQDKCPQNAAFQVPCPVVTLETFPVPAKKSVTLLVTDDSKAAVAISGVVKVPQVKATKSGSKGKKAETIQLTAASQTVEPGKIARFEVVFPKSLQSRLKELSAKKSLTLNLTATATDPVNRLTTSAVAVKLKGQAKPKPKHQA